MPRSLSAVAVAVVVMVVAASSRAPAVSQPSSKPQTRRVFVSVTDRSGNPVLDLGPADFEITEQGVKRQIAGAALAKSPMRVALLVDTSDGATAALNHLRAGLLAFTDTLPQPHEILLVSTGRQIRVRVQPTTDRKKVKDVAGAIFSDGGATPLMDALLEVDDRFMRKAEDRWPVFVIVTADGAESSAGANAKRFGQWLTAMPARGISAHAIVLKYRGGGTPEVIASQATTAAGGRFDFINTSNSLPDKMKALADAIGRDYDRASTRYEVSFLTDSAAAQSVAVAVAREGVKLETSQGRLR